MARRTKAPIDKAITSRRSAVRSSLRHERDKAIDRQRANARNIISRAMAGDSKHQRDMRIEQAITFSTSNLAHKVLNSFGVDVPIKVNMLSLDAPQSVVAYTNFQTINVSVKPIVDLKDMDSVAEFVFMIKGAVYHEGGHVLFTMPFDEMLTKVRNSTAVTKYQSEIQTQEQLYLLRRAWNIIEDQRMETAMVNESPILARYFLSTTVNVVIDHDNYAAAWPYITGRSFLPSEFRRMMRAAARLHPAAHLIHEIDSVVAQYRKSNKPIEMFDLVVRFSKLLRQWGYQSESNETRHQTSSGVSNDDRRDVPNPGNDQMQQYEQWDEEDKDKSNSKQQSSKTESDDNDGDDASSKSDGDSGDKQQDGGGGGMQNDRSDDDAPSGNDNVHDSDDTNGNPGEGQNNAAPTGDPFYGDDLNDEIRKQMEEMRDHTHDKADAESFVTTVNDDLRNDMSRDLTARPMASDMQVEACDIRNGIIAALEHLIDQTSPSWRYRQEHGVLDPTSFMMREPGETDYWSGLDDYGQQGYDLAVSVVLDTSYSMAYHMRNLSIAALAIRQACDELDVPCFVSTFNTVHASLYRSDEPCEPMQIGADGGTNPEGALNALNAQRNERKRHLVVILTDGEWSEAVTTLAPWQEPGRYFLLIGLNLYNNATLTNKNPDAWAMINDVLDLPSHFRKALSGFLA